MTDILGSTLQFVLWSGIYLSKRFDWNRNVTLLTLGPLATFSVWEVFSPIEISVPSSIGHPLNIILRLTSLGLTLLFLRDSLRKA